MNPLVALFRQADDVLRRGSSPARAQPRGWASSLGNFVLLILAFGMFYGGLMGTYGGVGGERIWQVVYSGVKVPLLLLATFVLSLPSFFVLNTLLGLRGDFARVVASLSGHAGGPDRDPRLTGPGDGVLVRLGLRVSTGDPLQRPDVRRGQHTCSTGVAGQSRRLNESG